MPFNIITLPHRVKDLKNKKFGNLLVIEFAGYSSSKRTQWLCLCDCGETKIALSHTLVRGVATHCGCLTSEKISAKVSIHGKSETPEFFTWLNIKQRCYNANHPAYIHYGERGIAVCERWLLSFEDFLQDMGQKPSPQHSIDRINNDGPYAKENCRWATREMQGQNKRNNILLTFNGKTQTLAAWSRETGKTWTMLYKRQRNGWSVEDTLTRPPRRH